MKHWAFRVMWMRGGGERAKTGSGLHGWCYSHHTIDWVHSGDGNVKVLHSACVWNHSERSTLSNQLWSQAPADHPPGLLTWCAHTLGRPWQHPVSPPPCESWWAKLILWSRLLSDNTALHTFCFFFGMFPVFPLRGSSYYCSLIITFCYSVADFCSASTLPFDRGISTFFRDP